MVRTCSVYGCLTTAKYNKDVKFHRFPRDARCHSWIDACRRPDLKNINIEQLYNKFVCSLHFERWMYIKKKLKSAALPVLNLPSSEINPMSTETETLKIEILRDLHSRVIQSQIEVTTVGVSAIACNSAQTTLTTTKITPKKRKLRKILKKCAKKLKLMEDTQCANVTSQQFLQGCDTFLSPNLSKIVKTQVNLKLPSKNNRYSKEFKLFCLNIYYSSPHAYTFLSKTLCLPSKRTLATQAIPMGTKICDYIWETLSQVVTHLSPSERECTFCIDEMSLKYSLFYDIHRDKIIGLHEIDDNQSPYAAGYAFTIMLRGILGNWKQVVGFAFVTTNKIGESLEEWIVNTIKKLLALGFKIRAIVSDHGSDFINFSKKIRISKEKPYFEIDGKKVYYIFDVPHLIKSVRNSLINYDFEFNGKTASWDDINKCYQLDKQKDIRCVPKLTDSHISPNTFQKQNLRLATQVLSNSVKTAVETYTKAGDLIPCDGTVEFIGTMDKLFDLLNSNNLFSPKLYNKPYRDNELQRNLLVQAQHLLNTLKVRQKNTGKDVTTTIKFVYAFSITLNAIIHLYNDLKRESGLDEFYLMTRRLNKDSLEFFFDIIRQAHENCREPTCFQFERAFRKSFLCQIFKLCSKSNGADDFDKVLSQYNEYTQNKSILTRYGVGVTRPTTKAISTSFDIPERNSFLYICAYVWRRCVDKHKCLSTNNYASTPTYSGERIKSNNYLRLRSSSTLGDSFGELQLPPADFTDYCKELEIQFRQNFRSFAGNKILEKLLNILKNVNFRSRPCSCFSQTFMIKLFIRMRIHYIIEFNNKNLKTSKNKVSGTYLVVSHV